VNLLDLTSRLERDLTAELISERCGIVPLAGDLEHENRGPVLRLRDDGAGAVVARPAGRARRAVGSASVTAV